jgi:hypothetical protein
MLLISCTNCRDASCCAPVSVLALADWWKHTPGHAGDHGTFDMHVRDRVFRLECWPSNRLPPREFRWVLCCVHGNLSSYRIGEWNDPFDLLRGWASVVALLTHRRVTNPTDTTDVAAFQHAAQCRYRKPR